VLTNRKPAHRKGLVQLINATEWYKPLRKNLGKKNCELSEEEIRRIVDTFLQFEQTEHSRIFPNAAFGYWKVTVERPLRLAGIDPERAYKPSEIRELLRAQRLSENNRVGAHSGAPLQDDTPARSDGGALSPDAPPVIKKIHKPGTAPDPLRGLFEVTIDGKPRVVEYEPDTELRDSEQIPFLECPACHTPGYLPSAEDERTAIETFLRREVLPYAPDAWYDPASVKVGYEINFNRYFYKPKALRTLDEIRTDLLAVEKEAKGLLSEILGRSQ
jgi:type I restriction enzyme M protein